jgi:hypothetical protein
MFKSKKNIKIYGLLFLFFGMLLANYSLPLLNSHIIDNSNESNGEINNDNPLDFQNQTPETSDYQNFGGAGENLNITLHQSLLNTSTIEFTNLDTSNSFTEPFPNFNGYNTSFINITVEDIYAPNKTLIIEDEELAFNELLDKAYYTSFQIPNNCYIENISIRVSTTTNQYLEVRIYNASWDGTYLNYDLPNTAVKQIPNVNHASPLWENITNWHQLLDPSNTDNNTFFVRVRSELDANANWYEGSDGTYDSIVWAHGAASPELGIDLNLKLGLSPINETPSPEQIKLKINNTIATGYGDGIDSGYWESTNIYSSASGELQFDVSADWWDVSCNITSVQINYTKTDVQAISSFDISGSGQTVQWNVTITNGLNYFDSRITDFNTINFTIPSIWQETTIKVFNGGTEIQASNINKRLLNNAYREVQVLNANNGTFWHLTANSTNLLSSIDTYVSGVAVSIANYSNIVEFNATFSEIIKNGDLNLSVYSPSPQYLNHSKILSISSADTEFLVSNWDVSDNVTQYGIFKIQMSWNK